MCGPECNIPRRILETEVDLEVIPDIVEKARCMAKCEFEMASKDIEKIGLETVAIDDKSWNMIASIMYSDPNSFKEQLKACKQLDEVFGVVYSAKRIVVSSLDKAHINRNLQVYSRIQRSLNLYLLSSLFSLALREESLGYITVDLYRVFDYYAQCCRTVVKEKLLELPNEPVDFFKSISYLLYFQKTQQPTQVVWEHINSKMFTKYKDLVQLIKRLCDFKPFYGANGQRKE